MRWSAALALNVDAVEAPDPYTVVFKLKKPNSRFHALFTVRWNAIWIMPKHVFEKVEDPLKFDFNKPVSLGAYVLHSYDPDGRWYIWRLREDWQRTTLGALRQAGPEIPRLRRSRPAGQARDRADEPRARRHPRRRARGHVHAGQAVEDARRLVQGLPLCASRSDPAGADLQYAERTVQEPGRALGAGAADRHQGGVDGVLSRRRHDLRDRRSADRHASGDLPRAAAGLARRTSSSTPASARSSPTIRPSASRSPTCCGPPWATRSQPIQGDRPSFGMGWWKADPQAAHELLEKAGFKKRGSTWQTPDGKPFTVRVVVEGEPRPVMTRAGSMIVQQWGRLGIDAKVDVAQGTLVTRRAAGDFDTIISWSVETWGGHQDLSYFLDSWHSQFVAEPGKPQPPRNWQRWAEPGARQDHRGDPQGRLRRSERRSSSGGVREARRARDADHPADGLQRVHGDGHDLLDRIPDRGRPLHRSGAELGQLARTCSSS